MVEVVCSNVQFSDEVKLSYVKLLYIHVIRILVSIVKRTSIFICA